jgi:hypothetical protein
MKDLGYQRELFSNTSHKRPLVPDGLIDFRLFGFGIALDPASPLTAALILLLAALGGFLLNFTPCVRPSSRSSSSACPTPPPPTAGAV